MLTILLRKCNFTEYDCSGRKLITIIIVIKLVSFSKARKYQYTGSAACSSIELTDNSC